MKGVIRFNRIENAYMSLLSMEFVIFWLITTLIYFIVPLKWRWTVLLCASYVFYFFGGIGTGYFMIITTVCVYICGLMLDKCNKRFDDYVKSHPDITKQEKKAYKSKVQKSKKGIVAVGLVISFAILVFLKYFNFLSEQTFSILHIFGVNTNAPQIDLALPLGISFYTLQATSYIIDIHRGKYKAEKNFAKLALYVSFFPQMIQGPIGRYDLLAHQLYEGHKFDFTKAKHGAELILWGVIKKIVLAETVGTIANTVFGNYDKYTGFVIFIGSVAYGLQLYADFSGGMDIVCGIAQIFGIEMSVNFERPYFARSIAEFWRRWHITLGAWMKDYVFYSIFFSKASSKFRKKAKSKSTSYIIKMLPTFLATFVSFLLVGIWHGSSWKYVAYGLWNSCIISMSTLLEPFYEKVIKKLKINTECFSFKLFQIVRTFILVSIGRIFSRADSFMISVKMLKRMFSEFNPWIFTDGTILNLGLEAKQLNLVIFITIVLFVVSLMQESGIKIRQKLDEQNTLFRWCVIICAVLFLMIYGAYGSSFSASDFVYQQF